MSNRLRRTSMGLLAAAILATGCTFNAGVNPTFYQYTPRAYAEKIPGKGAVEMPQALQEEAFSGKPTSFTGGATTLNLPLGEIVREAASLAFRDVFAQGAPIVEQADAGQAFAAVIRPRVTRFTYEYNQLKNVGFAITPTAVISLSVALTDTSGRTTWERSFESGNFEGPSYLLSGSPGEEISKVTHHAMMKVMQDAADAVHAELQSHPPALPKGDKAM